MKMRLIIVIFLSTLLACRPVLTIGWTEIAIIFVLLLILLGPALYKIYQRVAEFQKWKSSKLDKNQR